MFIYFVIFSALIDALTMLDSIITILFYQKLEKNFQFFLDEVVFSPCCDKRLGTRRDMCYSRLNPLLLPKDGI